MPVATGTRDGENPYPARRSYNTELHSEDADLLLQGVGSRHPTQQIDTCATEASHYSLFCLANSFTLEGAWAIKHLRQGCGSSGNSSAAPVIIDKAGPLHGKQFVYMTCQHPQTVAHHGSKKRRYTAKTPIR